MSNGCFCVNGELLPNCSGFLAKVDGLVIIVPDWFRTHNFSAWELKKLKIKSLSGNPKAKGTKLIIALCATEFGTNGGTSQRGFLGII